MPVHARAAQKAPTRAAGEGSLPAPRAASPRARAAPLELLAAPSSPFSHTNVTACSSPCVTYKETHHFKLYSTPQGAHKGSGVVGKGAVPGRYGLLVWRDVGTRHTFEFRGDLCAQQCQQHAFQNHNKGPPTGTLLHPPPYPLHTKAVTHLEALQGRKQVEQGARELP